jgi:hypothetical protein
MSLSSKEELRALLLTCWLLMKNSNKSEILQRQNFLKLLKIFRKKLSLKGVRRLLIMQLTIVIYFRPYKF